MNSQIFTKRLICVVVLLCLLVNAAAVGQSQPPRAIITLVAPTQQKLSVALGKKVALTWQADFTCPTRVREIKIAGTRYQCGYYNDFRCYQPQLCCQVEEKRFKFTLSGVMVKAGRKMAGEMVCMHRVDKDGRTEQKSYPFKLSFPQPERTDAPDESDLLKALLVQLLEQQKWEQCQKLLKELRSHQQKQHHQIDKLKEQEKKWSDRLNALKKRMEQQQKTQEDMLKTMHDRLEALESEQDLQLQWQGPEQLRCGSSGDYRLRVSNSGKESSRELYLELTVPAGLSYRGNSSGRSLRWPVSLDASASKEFEYRLQAERSGSYRVRARALLSGCELRRAEVTVTVPQAEPAPSEFTYLRTGTYSCGGQWHTVKEYRHDKTGLEFVLIPGGSFAMGSNDGESDEKPVHEVRLSSFLLSKTEVTQAVWQRIMKTKPWQGKSNVQEGANNPAVYVSWEDVMAFCKRTGLCLPTEAQWEYACRAGTTTKYYWGDSMDGAYCWYNSNAWNKDQKYAHQVGQKQANAFGLYDMSGNVWEWCQDWYDDSYYSKGENDNPRGPSTGSSRVLRGGSFVDGAVSCRSANRDCGGPGYRDCGYGVRFAAQCRTE